MGMGNQSRMAARLRGSRFTVLSLASGYVVCDPDGNVVSDPVRFRPQADRLRDEKQRAADAKAKRGPRPCMKCERDFESEGIHNRLCGPCRQSADPLDPVRPYFDKRGK